MTRHSIHPEAEAEFAEAVRYYSAINPNLGIRFYQSIERAINDARARPKRYFEFSPPARRVLLDEFPYSVVSVESHGEICIMAVMPGKRQPGYWRERLD